jgi:hypothetical protein
VNKRELPRVGGEIPSQREKKKEEKKKNYFQSTFYTGYLQAQLSWSACLTMPVSERNISQSFFLFTNSNQMHRLARNCYRTSNVWQNHAGKATS